MSIASTSPEAPGPEGSGPHFQPVAGAAEARGAGPHAVSAGGFDLVLVRTKGGPRLFQGRCPHQGALLGEGELDGDTLVCRNHRWRFDVHTGARQGASGCLVACPVEERGGELLADLSPLLHRPVSDAQAAPSPPVLRRLRDLPGPPGLPLVGNALQLDLRRIHLIFEKWAAQYGSLYAFRLGRTRSLVVSDPALTEQVFRKRPDTYRRVTKVQTVFKELQVDGVFSAEGSAWRPQRRLAMEALSQRHLRGFYPALRTVAERMLGRWRADADSGRPTDMVEDLKRFTVDVTTMLTFGHDMNTIEHTGDDVIQRRLELLFPAFNRRIFALLPYWRVVRLPRDRRLDRTVAELRTWIDGLVREARVRMEADPARAAQPANFLEAMLWARDEAGQPFSDQAIFANLMTMLLAGEDTTAATLAWAVHEMCETPMAVAALRAELDRALGRDSVPAELQSATALEYAGAVANEAMRLRPVAPFVFFETLVDTTLGDVALPAATPVAVLTRPPVRAPERFAEPDRFQPQRWIAPQGAHDAAAHIPFGSGPRICPGRSLALLEMKVMLALLYKNFEVRRVGDAADVGERFAFTMAPTTLTVALSRRAELA